MLSPVRTPKLIDVGELQSAVKHAVSLVDDSFIKTGTKPVFIAKWEIIGYRIKHSSIRNLPVADKFATDVARSVNQTGIKVDPVVAIVGGWITVGFIERINVPNVRSF